MVVHVQAARETNRARAGVGPLVSLLSVLQLSDSAFPSGRYTLSYGLESLVQTGHLPQPSDDRSMLIGLLGDSIRFGVAPSDGIALACAHRAVGPEGDVDLERVAQVEERLTAVKLPREAREASARTGRAMLAAATAALDAPALREYAERVRKGRARGNHAVVVGLLTAVLNIPDLEAVVGELYAFSSGWTAAAVRLGLLDHRMGQRTLHRVRPVIADAALEAVNRDVSQISSCTPLLDVMAMRHEEAELRLFAT
jgi:urease accessory protein